MQRPRGRERAEMLGSAGSKAGGCSCSGNRRPALHGEAIRAGEFLGHWHMTLCLRLTSSILIPLRAGTLFFHLGTHSTYCTELVLRQSLRDAVKSTGQSSRPGVWPHLGLACVSLGHSYVMPLMSSFCWANRDRGRGFRDEGMEGRRMGRTQLM